MRNKTTEGGGNGEGRGPRFYVFYPVIPVFYPVIPVFATMREGVFLVF